jgi:hypothetical protein
VEPGISNEKEVMKKPIAIAAAVLALGVAGTAVAAPGGGVFGGDHEAKQAEFASDLAQKLDGVNATEVEKGLEQIHSERQAEMLDKRAESLASGLDGVSVQQAKAALETVHESVGEGQRPDPSEVNALLAEELGVSEEDLDSARQAEMEQRLDQAVEDGAITEEQADEMRERIENGDLPKGGHPGGGHGGGPIGAGPGGPGGPGGGAPDGPPAS